MKLSIVICVYNTPAEYLRRCVDSIVSSSLSTAPFEYEICVVDDGSLLDYSSIREIDRVRYVRTENRGIFAARALGVEMAEGEYIAFCDSDDFVSSDYYVPMVNAAEKGVDIIINDWAFDTGRVKYYCRNDIILGQDLSCTGAQVFFTLLEGEGRYHSLYVLWNKVYRASVLRGAFEDIKASHYPQSTSYGEDALVNFFAYKRARSLEIIHTGYYFYRIHPLQGVNITSEEKLKKQVDSMALAFEIMEKSLCPQGEEKLRLHIRHWRELLSRAHYTRAMESSYFSVFPFIKERYGVDKLERETAGDVYGYLAKTLLGDNFEEVDSTLAALWSRQDKPTVTYHKGDKYTHSYVSRLVKDGKVSVGTAGQSIPKMRVSLKKKIAYNPFVYKVGLVIFKKNSRLRKALKGKI